MRNGNLTQTQPRNGATIPARPGRRRWRFVTQLLSAIITAALTAATATPAFAVFNGSSADSDDYAWAVRVQLAYPEGIASCTGSLINEDTVVTAAHCIRNNGRSPSAIDVTFHYGEKRNQYTVGVARAVPMPHYDPALIKDDIALLFLQSAVSEPAIELASAPAPVGAEVTVAGYGCTGNPFNAAEPCDAARRLIETQLTTVPAEACPDIAGPWQFCTYSPDTSANRGDSGGPVIWSDHGEQKLIGVTNALELPPAPAYLNLSASVPYELDWIKATAGLR
ncbi:trypsin-like serine protease [Arthrobacter sp. ISL-69]|uniref:S1 family peptidase n=1 Tax=Arthrobacter sp. ISL-69 TaxID=2819113 RepID=UPI001BEC6820|nr:S1 family peptidase [Arthrobacter sp. ISL-69]MBT2537269.1 S1 family peptidase [Arthrobacter sp. ISL-69]